MSEYRMTAEASHVLFVSGLVGRDEAGGPITGTVPQAQRIFERLQELLATLGLKFDSVVRVRIYLTDIAEWSAVSAVVASRFAESVPPCTVLGVTALVEPWMGVEIDFEVGIPATR
jgi:enamine deaminase RidA (YjgF/YER057c/UK114 family)